MKLSHPHLLKLALLLCMGLGACSYTASLTITHAQAAPPCPLFELPVQEDYPKVDTQAFEKADQKTRTQILLDHLRLIRKVEDNNHKALSDAYTLHVRLCHHGV
jgi:hypothetical protein